MFALLSPCFALGVLEGARAASGGPFDGAEPVADAPDRPERSRIAEDHTPLRMRSFSAPTLRIPS
ncbi:MAG TPA: hypothetical protein VGB15_23760 [Longimicrobium sp.]|jgi:hypothetical protein